MLSDEQLQCALERKISNQARKLQEAIRLIDKYKGKVAELNSSLEKKNIIIGKFQADYDFLKGRILKLHGRGEFVRLMASTDNPSSFDIENFKNSHKEAL